MIAIPDSAELGTVQPHIEFNHLFVTLDKDTVESVSESDLISAHFSVSKTTVEAKDSSWTALFLRGRRTYLELFEAGGAEDMEKGYSGIAFSTQRLGQVDQMEQRLEELAPQRVERALRVRKDPDGEVPWFHYLQVQPSEWKGFSAWLMEVHEDYMASREIEASAPGLFDRRAYMSALDPSETSHLDDIIEVHLRLSSDERADLELLLRGLGFQSSGSLGSTVYTSGQFALNISDSSDPDYRIERVVCTTAQPLTEAHEVHFGDDAALQADGDRMIWLFGPPAGYAR
jgi:hypothetical protein